LVGCVSTGEYVAQLRCATYSPMDTTTLCYVLPNRNNYVVLRTPQWTQLPCATYSPTETTTLCYVLPNGHNYVVLRTPQWTDTTTLCYVLPNGHNYVVLRTPQWTHNQPTGSDRLHSHGTTPHAAKIPLSRQLLRMGTR